MQLQERNFIMRKRWLLGSALALALLLSACGEKDTPEAPAAAGVPVEVQSVALGSISTVHKLSGTVATGKTEQIYVAVSARVIDVFVEAGDSIRAGQTLCRLDLKSFRDNLELAQMTYDNAVKNRDDQLVILDQQIAQQEQAYQNALALLEAGASSQLEVDGAKLTLDAAMVNRSNTLAQMDLAVKNAEKGITQINDTLKNVASDGSVTSSASGTIVSLSIGKDSYVSAGMPVAVVEAVDMRKLTISASESLVPKLKVGDRAQVTVAAVNQNFEAKISEISKTVDPQSRLYTVTLTVPSNVTGLMSGMFAEVNLYTDSRDNTVVVPTEALLTQEDGQYVITLAEDGTAHRMLVQTGLIGDGVTEITTGLVGGETLVTVGQAYLKDGDAARVVSPQE